MTGRHNGRAFREDGRLQPPMTRTGEYIADLYERASREARWAPMDERLAARLEAARCLVDVRGEDYLDDVLVGSFLVTFTESGDGPGHLPDDDDVNVRRQPAWEGEAIRREVRAELEAYLADLAATPTR